MCKRRPQPPAQTLGPHRAGIALILGLSILMVGGCSSKKTEAPKADAGPLKPGPSIGIIQGCRLEAVGAAPADDATILLASRNETASLVLQLANFSKPGEKSKLTLRLSALKHADQQAQIEPAQMKAWQVLSMPVDVNRAGFVRHTGQRASSRALPRALVPVSLNHGALDVLALRDPAQPLRGDARLSPGKDPALLWIDISVPPTAAAGAYSGLVQLLRDGQVIDTLPLSLTVYDLVLPDERHLHMVGRIEWDSLQALYPDLFEAITPHLVSRNEKKYEAAVKLLDQLISLAHDHRTDVVVPALGPVVKWPANAPPQVDWSDFDSVAEPWLNGSAFADKVPTGYWPLPRTQFLDRYPVPLQMQYWMAAASHFDQRSWSDRGWVEVEKETPGRATAIECVQLSTQAAQILSAHPRLRATLPLEDHQLQFLSAGNKDLLDRGQIPRLMTASAGLVYTPVPADKQWPAGLARPSHWLRTDLPGLVPYIGAGGDERDVRLWAWLAFLRQAQVIGWDGALPHTRAASEPADPNELTWFYPGRWFGLEEPVPTVQLKWLRRAQQDYEYLHLAKQRNQTLYALVMARLLIKPVQIQLHEEPDPTHGLLSGTTDPRVWGTALDLLARNILLHGPGSAPDPAAQAQLNAETTRWVAPQDRPLEIARGAAWGWAARPGNWVDLRLGLDIYNASDQPQQGQLEWVSAPKAWEFNPQPVAIGPEKAIKTYQVRPFTMDAWVNLEKLSAESRKPIQLKFTDTLGKRQRISYLTAVVPVAPCDRREGRLAIDGNLGDWDDAADGIHHGPLTVMLDRQSVQQQAIQPAATPSSLYANWAAKHFYTAFKLQGLSAPSGDEGRVEKNFVDYQLRRAWGEDLCELLIQPIYTKPGDVGQVVHIVCKPRGQVLVSTRNSPKNQKLLGSAFKEVVGADIRFATSVEGRAWRGELAIPWELVNDKDHQGLRPTLMRFNFVQYKSATGESASWAGPIDFGRDDSFMGLLFLRELKSPGM